MPSEGELVSPKNLLLLIASNCISQVLKKELPGAPGGILDPIMLIVGAEIALELLGELVAAGCEDWEFR